MALILSRTDVQQCLTMPEAIEAMRLAFGALSTGHVHVSQRSSTSLQEEGVVLLMPSLLQTLEAQAFGLKIITVMPHQSRLVDRDRRDCNRNTCRSPIAR